MATNKANVVVQININPQPEEHEVTAAWILARHFGITIEFLKPIDGYKLKTPDINMNGIEWELKSPTGHSKTTISNNLIIAKLQSPNIVFDTRRTTIPDIKIHSELSRYLAQRKSISRILMITKDEKVLEIQKKR